MKDTDKEIQKAVAKLIAEEWIAGTMYKMMTLACKQDQRGVIKDLFNEIGNDEIDDHFASLVKWCDQFGCYIPCSEDEFNKLADKKLVKLAKEVKKGQDAKYYIEKALESEELAINSYKEVLDEQPVHIYTELQSILWSIYYDEEEHLKDLNSSLIACDANVEMII